MDSAQDSYKKWGIALVVFLLILIPSGIFLFKSNLTKNLADIKTNTNEYPKSDKNTIQFKSFFIVLEYDPNLKTATKLGSGGFKGETDKFSDSPSSSNSKFSYKVETYSNSGQLLSSGWISKSKFVITGDNGKYQFRIYTIYAPGNSVKVLSTDNQVFWSGKI